MSFELTYMNIEDIADVKSGKRLPKDHSLTIYPTAYPYIRLVDIANGKIEKSNLLYLEPEAHHHISRYIVNEDDVCLAIVGHTIGVVFYVDKEFDGVNLTENAARITNWSNNVNSKYIFYYLSSLIGYNEIISRKVGSAQGKLPIYAIREIKIPLPSKTQQDEIAKTLSCLDNKITLLRQQNQDLEELAQTLFKRWFVEFEFPNENGEPYKSSGGKMVASELGEIPEGWTVSTIGENIETIGGGTPSTTESEFWEDGEILWYSPTDLTKENSMFSNGSAKRITELGLQKSSAKLFPAYSLLMTSRATVGEITINTQRACTNQGFITLIPNDNLSIYFLYDWLKSKLKTVHNLASGSTFPEISRTDFRNIEVLLAANDVHSKFDNTVIPIFKSIENNTQEIQILSQLRDTLLPKLMSGDLRGMH